MSKRCNGKTVLLYTFQLYKGRINATSHLIQHPMYGAGHKYRTLHLPISTTLAEVLDRVSGMFQYRKLNVIINICLHDQIIR